MLPFPLIYSERYDLNLGDHVFPTRKYRLLRDYLLRKKLADLADFVEPEPAATGMISWCAIQPRKVD